jgi:hypothetical protein
MPLCKRGTSLARLPDTAALRSLGLNQLRGDSQPRLNRAPLRLASSQTNADAVLLVYLSVLIAVIALFAYVFWRAMEPTVLDSTPGDSISLQRTIFEFPPRTP